MRSRLALLAVLAGLIAACASEGGTDRRSMPEFQGDRRPEQINSPGR